MSVELKLKLKLENGKELELSESEIRELQDIFARLFNAEGGIIISRDVTDVSRDVTSEIYPFLRTTFST